MMKTNSTTSNVEQIVTPPAIVLYSPETTLLEDIVCARRVSHDTEVHRSSVLRLCNMQQQLARCVYLRGGIKVARELQWQGVDMNRMEF